MQLASLAQALDFAAEFARRVQSAPHAMTQ